ncbi:MAG: hypothetical protein FWD19_00900 [Defluviitaleaceae bacterium]|nr:hypothetical protein [Defluviitaleaceae bacterium]
MSSRAAGAGQLRLFRGGNVVTSRWRGATPTLMWWEYRHEPPARGNFDFNVVGISSRAVALLRRLV